MKALILAAGASRRLRPITNALPKSLLQVGGKTILARQVEALLRSGTKDIIVGTGFKHEVIEKYLLENYSNLNFRFIRNHKFESTNAGYSLWLAKDHVDGDMIYLNADLVYENAVFQKVIGSDLDSVTAIQKTPWDAEQVNVILDNENRILSIGKDIPETESEGEFLGLTKLGKEFNMVLKDVLGEERDFEKMFAVDIIDSAIRKGGVMYASDVSAHKACEIDTIEDYERAKDLDL